MPFLRLHAELDFLSEQLHHSCTLLAMLRTQVPLTKCRLIQSCHCTQRGHLFPEECTAYLSTYTLSFHPLCGQAPRTLWEGTASTTKPSGLLFGKYCCFLKGNKSDQRGSTEDVYGHDHTTTCFMSIYEAHLFPPAQARPILPNIVSSRDTGSDQGKRKNQRFRATLW